MRKFIIIALVVLLGVGLIFGLAGVVHAGQPNASCESDPGATRPGNSSTAPGSAFNPDGVAGSVYAGEQDQNNNNPHSVSQYDVACDKNASH